MSENTFNENSFRDYYMAENSDDEENNNDLVTRLYAEIYYPSNNEIELGANILSNAVPLSSCVINESINGPENIQYNFNKVISELEVVREQEEPVVEEFIQTNKKNLAEQKTNTAEVQENKKCLPKKHKSMKQTRNKHRERSQKENIVSVDELDMNSKYNVVQKNIEQEIGLNNLLYEEISDESDSESIFEVPISPKPKPLIIDLQDSDDEDAGSSIDEDDLLEGRLHGKNTSKDDSRFLNLKALSSSKMKMIKVSLNHQDIAAENNTVHKSPQNKNKNTTSAMINDKSVHAHEVHEDIILNCTKVQKGAKNINEIKQLYKSAEQDRIETFVVDISSKKRLSQDTLKGNSLGDACTSQELCQTSQEQGIETGKQVQQSVCDVLQTCETNETENTCTTLIHDLRYAVQTLENTLLEVSCSANNKLVMSQKRHSQGNSEEDEDGEDREGEGSGRNEKPKNNSPARKRQCTIQQNDQLNVAQTSRSSDKRTKRSSSFRDACTFRPLPEVLNKFYNDSRGQENFDIEEIQRNMSKDPRKWAILDEDLMPSPAIKRSRYWSSLRCSYCQRDGHLRRDCPDRTNIKRCHMCGKQGHITWRCPQQVCLTCGKKQDTYLKNCDYCRTLYCTMCYSVGHKKENCPDLWRRYHSVTQQTGHALRNPRNVMKPASQLHCCNCSKRGHESSTCKEYRWSIHFPTPSFVTNYTEGPVYKLEFDSKRISQNTEIPNTSSFKTKNNKILSKQMHGNMPKSQATLPSPDVDDVSSSSVTAKTDKETCAQSTQEQVLTISKLTKLKFANVLYCCGNYPCQNNHDARALVSNLSEHKELCLEGKQLLQNRFSNGTVFPIFLRKLRKIVEFEIIIGLLPGKSEVMVQLMAPKDCIYSLFHLLLYWLNLPLTEKQHGLDVNLPMQIGQMYSFLMGLNIFKLSKEIKNPMKLYNTMNGFKNKLRNMVKNKEYFHNQTSLWGIQIKLLKFINTHPEPSVYLYKMSSYMEKLKAMMSGSDLGLLDASTYLDILLCYNSIYTPHTPPNLRNILRCIMNQSSTKIQEFIEEQQLVSNINVNPPIPFTMSSSCTPQETDTVINPLALNNVPNVPDDTSNIIGNTIVCQLGTNDTMENHMENQHPQNILPAYVEPVSNQFGNSQRKNGQWSTDNVNINTNSPVTESNMNTTHNQSNDQKVQLKKLRHQEKQKNLHKFRQEAEKVMNQARTYKLPYMIKVVEDMVKKSKNKTLKKKDVQKVKKMMKMEDKHQKVIKQFCSHLN